MSANSFDTYVKQNECEFYEEYAKCKNDREVNTKIPNKSNETKGLSNNQQEQTLCTNNIPSDIPIATKILSSIIGNDTSQEKIKQVVFGYCYPMLRKGKCWKYECKFKHTVSINIMYIYLFALFLINLL